jgi:signal transduction histidine kinase
MARNSKMGKSLAQRERGITLLVPEPAGEAGTESTMPIRKPRSASRRPASARAGSTVKPRTAERRPQPVAPEAFYRDLVWNLRNGVVAVTREGRIAVMNGVAYRILALKAKITDIGAPFTQVLKDQPDVVRIIAGAFELSHLPNRAELRLKSTGKVIGYTLSQVIDNHGKVSGATLFFKDLTRVEQLEERERLRDRLAALGEMAAAIAHEVKNPLAGIEVMAGILKRQLPESPDAQTTLADIIKEAKMANVIVQEVLAFVRPLRLQVEDVAVADVVRDAITMAENHPQKGQIQISVGVPESLRPIQGDSHQLRQIFTNFLTNAFEAMNGTGTIAITAVAIEGEEESTTAEQMPGPMVLITITDDGPGIPPEVMDRIFSPFFTTKPQGSGLGLAIVRKIVDAHDGRIDVGERPGGGTIFRVTLPVRNQQQLFE